MLAWQQVPYVKTIIETTSFLWQLHLSKCLNTFSSQSLRRVYITFWAYAFDLVTSSFKNWLVTNKLKKNNGLSSAGTSIIIPSFLLNWNTFKTGSALDQLSFDLSLLSSPLLELSSAGLLLSIVSEPWFTGFLSSALDGVPPWRLTEPWFTEPYSSALELSDSREDLSERSLRLHLPPCVLTPLFKQTRVVRITPTKPPSVLTPYPLTLYLIGYELAFDDHCKRNHCHHFQF